jgi:hypothetical protein
MTSHYYIFGNGGTGGPIDYSTPIATSSGTSWSTAPLAPGSTWAFGIRAFDPSTGLEESNVDAVATLALDGSGADVTHTPIPPALVTAAAIAGGGVAVSWCYPLSAARSAARPAGFRVYIGTSGASPDHATTAATIAYGAGVVHYRATLAGPLAGPVAASVRAYNAAGEDDGTAVATVATTAAGPAAVDGLGATATAGAG